MMIQEPMTLTDSSSIAALLVAVSLGTLCGCGESEGPVATRALPLDLEGRRVDVLAGSGARATVLLFTLTDCPISNRYAPEVRRICAEFEPRGIEFWLVYPNPGDTAARILGHMQEYGYTCRALRDPEHALVATCGASITPEAAVFLPGQRMVYRGRIDDTYVDFGRRRKAPTSHDLEDVLAAIVQGLSPTLKTTPAVGCSIADLK